MKSGKAGIEGDASVKAIGGQRWNNGTIQATDTGIFRLIDLPYQFVSSHEYFKLAEVV